MALRAKRSVEWRLPALAAVESASGNLGGRCSSKRSWECDVYIWTASNDVHEILLQITY
jgi:hypothetical protein